MYIADVEDTVNVYKLHIVADHLCFINVKHEPITLDSAQTLQHVWLADFVIHDGRVVKNRATGITTPPFVELTFKNVFLRYWNILREKIYIQF